MGECFIRFYQNKVKKSWKIAFVSAFVLGLLIHLYKLTNVLLVSDSLYNFYSSQNMVASGRWFLSVACALGSYFDLPWLNGVLSLLFMSLAAVAVTEVFEMENPCLIAVSSGILVSVPAVYATMGFSFTSDGYMLAMFLAALGVVFSKMPRSGSRINPLSVLLSAVCICLACGIYQAYLSFAFVLAVCYFIMELLENRNTKKEYLIWIGTQALIFCAALVAYFVIWKLCMHLGGVAATAYQGISGMGQMNGGGLLSAALNAVKSFVLYFTEWDVFKYGFTRRSVLNLLCVAVFGIGMVAALFRSGCIKRALSLTLVILCLISIPFGCFALMFASSGINYHGVMLQSFAILFVLTGVLCNRWCKGGYSTAVFLLLCAFVFNNAVMTNMYYNFLDQCMRRTESVATEINTRIHLLDDGQIKYVTFIGMLDKHPEGASKNEEFFREMGGWRIVARTLISEHFLYNYTDFNLLYYRENNIEFPVVDYEDEPIPAPADWEFRFPLLSPEREAQLLAQKEVQDMPIWPAADSVQVFGDTIVIKLSEPLEVE